jgi:predicted amidohydrolase YtcJ
MTAMATQVQRGGTTMNAERSSKLIFAGALFAGLVSGAAALAADADRGCDGLQAIRLFNGKIHTMDANDSVVSSVSIKDGKFAAVGRGFDHGGGRCTRAIDLRGRTVVPGIIDNHNHIILLGLRPGHDTRLENANSIQEVLATLAARAAELPAGEWITSLGGFDINQFVPPPDPPRYPTLAELDSVTPNHPVLLLQGFNGPSATNSLGKAFFETRGVTIGADGSIAAGTDSLIALNQLRRLDEADGKRVANQKRGTMDAMTYAAMVGVTTHLDQGGFPAVGDNTDGLANFDRYRAHDAVQALYQEGKLINRIRINFLHLETDPATPELRARLLNTFPNFGDEWLRILGIGEFTAQGLGEAWRNGTRLVAEAPGWSNENHSLSATDFITIIDEWELVNSELPAPGITERRWVLAHVPFITEDYLQKLKALGGGVSVLGGWRWLSGTPTANGPPFRTILASGIRAGMSSDGMQISPMNPWIGMYYAVTGKNSRGVLINDGQQISRKEVLRLYTAANGWFLHEEDKIGTIEEGKYADLIVLSEDYFDPVAVPDDKIIDIHPLLTIVNGKVVHDDLERKQKKYWSRKWRRDHGFRW